VMREYKVLYEQALSAENYWDAAYLRGYAVGLSFLLVGDEQRKQLPVYFVFGSDKELVTVEDFRRELDRAASLHTQAHEEALRLVQGAESGTELYHPPHFGPWA